MNTNKTLKLSKLKSFIALSSLLAAPALTAHAEDHGSGISLGALGSIAINNPSFKGSGTNTKVDGKTSYGGGVLVQERVNDILGLEEDVLYMSSSFSSKTAEFFGSSVNSTVSSGYLHIPVMLRVRPIEILNLGAGAYYSRTLSAWSVSGPGFSDKNVNYGKNDWGYELAVGADIPMDRFNIVADVRYSHSFNDNGGSTSDKLKFSDVRFLAGVRYDF